MLPKKADREKNNESAAKCREYDVQAIVIGAAYKHMYVRMKEQFLDLLTQNESHLELLIENDNIFDNAQRTRKLLSINSDTKNALLRERDEPSANTSSDKKGRSEQKRDARDWLLKSVREATSVSPIDSPVSHFQHQLPHHQPYRNPDAIVSPIRSYTDPNFQQSPTYGNNAAASEPIPGYPDPYFQQQKAQSPT
ncbi:hypothetical protein PENTCL1PPCAC_24302, partial [Pristionchus entomophagus]